MTNGQNSLKEKNTLTDKLKTLIFDIETSPIIIPTFDLWGEKNGDHKSLIQDWFVISVAWKWLGDKKVDVVSVLDDEKRFAKDHTDDTHVIKTIHKVLSEADIIVGHNVIKFDWKKLNTRFIKHGLDPISKKRIADTLRIAKREFNFTSNRLDYIATYLGLGAKMETPKGLWLDTLRGDVKALRTMVKYNKMDVVITEKVYLALRPYDTAPINLSSACDEGMVCPKCGSKHFTARGYNYTSTGKFQRYQCSGCKGWFASKVNLLKQSTAVKVVSQ